MENNPVLPVKPTLKKRIQKMKNRTVEQADVDFENGMLNIDKNRSMAKNRNRKANENAYIMHEGTTKNEKARKIELTPEAIEVLLNIKKRQMNSTKEDFIVITETGKPNTTTNIEHRMETIYRHAGLTHLKGGVHILRKTFATEMYEKGGKDKRNCSLHW